MKKINRTTILLLCIILLSLCLRLWQLGQVPPSPDWDEVALGYDAYSLLHTGRDEYGKFLPVVLRSFDDYKPALYAYLAIPSVAIFGLSTFAIRLPSAIFGVLAVVATFYLVRALFKRESLALVAAFLLAISPWHIQFSRVAFEANVGDALNIFAALFFILGLKRPWLFTLSALSAALSLYSYQSEKVFVPLFMLLLFVIYYKDVIRVEKKKLIVAGVVGLVVIFPMLYAIMTDPAVLQRAKGTSVFSNQTELLKNQIRVIEHESSQGDTLGLIFDNRRVVYAQTILGGYLAHFDPNWLLHGDIPRHHAPEMGLLYLWELPFILIGIYSLLFHKFDKKTKLFIFGWFLLAPLPASITNDVPHAVRTLNFLPTWQIFTAIGLVTAITYIKRYRVAKISYVLLLGIILFNFVYYLNQYFVQQNYFNGPDWQYGYEKVVPYVADIQGKYKKIVVSDDRPMDKSYMFFLFYLKYPPQEYQKVASSPSHAFDKYEFRPIAWSTEKFAPQTLYIGRPGDFPAEVKILKEIKYPNGESVMKVVEDQKQ